MPAIAPNIGLLAGVCFLTLASLRADTHADVIDLFASTAAALAEVNVPQFMNAFDKDMPGYDKLKSEVTGLTTQNEISSSVEPIKDEGDESKRAVDLDWYLQVRSLLQSGPVTTRREVIHCELRKQGKHWKVVSLQPLEFFAPAKLDK
jgi:hypothetical protein